MPAEAMLTITPNALHSLDEHEIAKILGALHAGRTLYLGRDQGHYLQKMVPCLKYLAPHVQVYLSDQLSSDAQHFIAQHISDARILFLSPKIEVVRMKSLVASLGSKTILRLPQMRKEKWLPMCGQILPQLLEKDRALYVDSDNFPFIQYLDAFFDEQVCVALRNCRDFTPRSFPQMSVKKIVLLEGNHLNILSFFHPNARLILNRTALGQTTYLKWMKGLTEGMTYDGAHDAKAIDLSGITPNRHGAFCVSRALEIVLDNSLNQEVCAQVMATLRIGDQVRLCGTLDLKLLGSALRMMLRLPNNIHFEVPICAEPEDIVLTKVNQDRFELLPNLSLRVRVDNFASDPIDRITALSHLLQKVNQVSLIHYSDKDFTWMQGNLSPNYDVVMPLCKNMTVSKFKAIQMHLPKGCGIVFSDEPDKGHIDAIFLDRRLILPPDFTEKMFKFVFKNILSGRLIQIAEPPMNTNVIQWCHAMLSQRYHKALTLQVPATTDLHMLLSFTKNLPKYFGFTLDGPLPAQKLQKILTAMQPG